MDLLKRFFVYLGILLVVGGAAAYHVLTDFASTPYPPDMTLEAFHPETPGNIPEHRVWQPKFPVIDVHSHPQESGKTPDELIKIMDASGVRAIVDLDGHWGWIGHRIKRKLEEYNLKYPGRFILFTKIDFGRYSNPDFVEETIQRLEQSVKWGVKGVKVWKNLGMMYRDASGKIIPLDDPRLDPIWDKIGELGIPVLIHTADPVAFWQPVDRFNERYEELTEGGSWFDSYANGDYPSFETLMQQRAKISFANIRTRYLSVRTWPSWAMTSSAWGECWMNSPTFMSIFPTGLMSWAVNPIPPVTFSSNIKTAFCSASTCIRKRTCIRCTTAFSRPRTSISIIRAITTSTAAGKFTA
ncbi:MAG: amidohydrolase family protein [candidate division KSB1 bacterium]|nr:amidohydrolase family protein [candidate division KSB1 bacterium]